MCLCIDPWPNILYTVRVFPSSISSFYQCFPGELQPFRFVSPVLANFPWYSEALRSCQDLLEVTNATTFKVRNSFLQRYYLTAVTRPSQHVWMATNQGFSRISVQTNSPTVFKDCWGSELIRISFCGDSKTISPLPNPHEFVPLSVLTAYWTCWQYWMVVILHHL